MAQAKLYSRRDYPPMPYLEQVLNHAPKAGQVYLWLWRHANEDHVCHLRASLIADCTMISKTSFKNSLRALCREGLLSFQEHDDIVEIELVGWDYEES